MVLGGVGDIQEAADLFLAHVRASGASCQRGVGELEVVSGLVVLQGADEVVAVEQARVVAQRAQG